VNARFERGNDRQIMSGKRAPAHAGGIEGLGQ
jgi:hypothetical protein